MSRIEEDLRFMDPLEIVLNYGINNRLEETVKELLKLPVDEQEKFLNDCKNQIQEVTNQYVDFVRIYEETK